MDQEPSPPAAPPPDRRVIAGDCVAGMDALEAGTVPLIVADPPYNLDKEYDQYHDRRAEEDYLAWTETWLTAALRVLGPRGTLWVFLPDEWAADADVFARRRLGLTRQTWVVWAFGFGVARRLNFARGHCHLLRYTMSPTEFTFNAGEVRVPSDRQAIYNDRRAHPAGKLPNDVWLLHRAEIERAVPVDADLWYHSRICGSFHERRRQVPNQLPLVVLRRIVLATSAPGDLVLDPFAGTGGCGEVCARHGRGYLGYDLSPEYARLANERLRALAV